VDRQNATGGGFEATSRSVARVTPDDVQRKEFGTARVRAGYLMHEVDEFLDEVTDSLSSLQAENEQLRAQVAGTPAARAGAPPEAASPASGADRAAVESFLRREKAFLESLGSLVQDHAEELRGMVRSVRRAAPEPDSASEPAPPAPAPSVEPSPAPAVAPSTAAPGPEPTEPPSPRAVTEASASGETERDADAAAILDEVDPEPPAIEAVKADDPIRVDEPQPTGRRRRDDPSEGSLRELFWGEE
jgi:DivIVA domain-containing protein